MQPDDNVCICFKVSLRKIRSYLARENPPVASLISECLGAGTGCGWCVPFLKHLHAEHAAGREPDLRVSPEHYAHARKDFKATRTRDAGTLAAEGIEPTEQARSEPGFPKPTPPTSGSVPSSGANPPTSP